MKPFIALLLIFVFPLQGVAAEGFYAGLKLGIVSVDEDEIDDLRNTRVEIDDGGLGGLVVGYDFGKRVSLEFEIAGSEHDLSYVPGYDQLDIGLLGMYVAYRSGGQWYFKARGGLLSRTLDIHASSPFAPNLDEDSDGFVSIGAGGGVRIDRLTLEAEVTTIEKGIGSFGIVAAYHF